MNPQGTDEWKLERCGHLTASKMADALATIKSGEAAARRNLRVRLAIERLTGTPMENGYQSQAMLDGIDNEPLARIAYEMRSGNLVEPVGFVKHKTIEWFGSSPDGLVGDDGLIECKCPLPATHIGYLLGEKVPAEYIPQMGAQLCCTGRKWVDFVSFCPVLPDRLALFVVRYAPSAGELRDIESAAKSLLSEVDDLVENLMRMAA